MKLDPSLFCCSSCLLRRPRSLLRLGVVTPAGPQPVLPLPGALHLPKVYSVCQTCSIWTPRWSETGILNVALVAVRFGASQCNVFKKCISHFLSVSLILILDGSLARPRSRVPSPVPLFYACNSKLCDCAPERRLSPSWTHLEQNVGGFEGKSQHVLVDLLSVQSRPAPLGDAHTDTQLVTNTHSNQSSFVLSGRQGLPNNNGGTNKHNNSPSTKS